MTINEDFKAFLAQRGQELAGQPTAAQTAYERQERLAAEGGELFGQMFADLDAQTKLEGAPVENSTPDPAEAEFNQTFGL